jgi:hypothetical protein
LYLQGECLSDYAGSKLTLPTSITTTTNSFPRSSADTTPLPEEGANENLYGERTDRFISDNVSTTPFSHGDESSGDNEREIPEERIQDVINAAEAVFPEEATSIDESRFDSLQYWPCSISSARSLVQPMETSQTSDQSPFSQPPVQLPAPRQQLQRSEKPVQGWLADRAEWDEGRQEKHNTIQEGPTLKQRNIEQEPLRTSIVESTPPHMEKAVISIEDLTILLRDSNLILTEPMEQVYRPKEEPSLVDIILIDDVDTNLSSALNPEALRNTLGTSCGKARLIHCVCNIEIENSPRETSSNQPFPNTMPPASQTSPAKDKVYDHTNTPSSQYSYLEYIRSISDHISPMPDPNGERLVTIIYRSMAIGAVVKRAIVTPLEPSELSPLPTFYSLRWLDPNWRIVEYKISDLLLTADRISCNLPQSHLIDPLEIQRQGPVPHAVFSTSASYEPFKPIRDVKKEVPNQRAAGHKATAECRSGYVDVFESGAQIDKAIAHARRRNRFRIFTVFEKPIDAVKDLASLL